MSSGQGGIDQISGIAKSLHADCMQTASRRVLADGAIQSANLSHLMLEFSCREMKFDNTFVKSTWYRYSRTYGPILSMFELIYTFVPNLDI